MNIRDYSFRTLVKYWLIAVVTLLMLGFILFQARFLVTGPRIVLTEVPQGPQNERQVTIAGTAYNISRLWLNDRPIYTDAEGNFKEAIVLENGYTIATLRAQDRYGRTTEVSRPLVYVPASFKE
jgi:uncharacterized membrane-anchored protein